MKRSYEAANAVAMAVTGGSCPSRVRLPGFDGATGWLNSAPLTPADLRGKVVLRRLLDVHVHQLAPDAPLRPRVGGEVRGAGLVVVGVHTPEFPFEHDIDNVRRAVQDMGVEYPIAIDSDYAVWHAFSNRYWPAVYSPTREGGSDITSSARAATRMRAGDPAVAGRHRAGRLDDELVSVAPDGFEAQADWGT